jgi:SAM-dependent methyltransferase
MNMRDAWEEQASNWIAWARDRQDSYWRFHGERFLALLPQTPCAAIDVGCGEGRLTRDLRARGHSVVGVDGSATLIACAREADPTGDYRVADAAALPIADESVALVTALMSLHDTDDMPGAVREAARVLVPGGRYCIATIHPFNSAGRFDTPDANAPFAIRNSYFEQRRYADTITRGDLTMTFNSTHRPLQAYVAAIEAAGLLVERLVEMPEMADPPTGRWRRVPLYIHLRTIKPA